MLVLNRVFVFSLKWVAGAFFFSVFQFEFCFWFASFGTVYRGRLSRVRGWGGFIGAVRSCADGWSSFHFVWHCNAWGCCSLQIELRMKAICTLNGLRRPPNRPRGGPVDRRREFPGEGPGDLGALREAPTSFPIPGRRHRPDIKIRHLPTNFPVNFQDFAH